MGWDFYTGTSPVAKKDHNCGACEWILNSCDWGMFTFAELRIIVKARRDGWKIKKGQKYIKCSGRWNGEWDTFRARPEINDLCQKYDIYQE